MIWQTIIGVAQSVIIHVIHIVIGHVIIIRHHIPAAGNAVPAVHCGLCIAVITAAIEASAESVAAPAIAVAAPSKLINPIASSGRKTEIINREKEETRETLSDRKWPWEPAARKPATRSAARKPTTRSAAWKPTTAALNHLLPVVRCIHTIWHQKNSFH